LLEKIIPRAVLPIAHLEAAELWQINANNLLLEGISRQIFAHHCDIKFNCFRTANCQCEKSSPTNNNIIRSQRLVEKKINLDNMVLKRKKLGSEWRSKEFQRHEYDDSLATLSARTNQKITVYQEIVPQKKAKGEPASDDRKKAWESIDPSNQVITELLIEQENCLNNTEVAARIWCQYKDQLQDQGVNDNAFSYKCAVPYFRFTYLVSQIVKQPELIIID